MIKRKDVPKKVKPMPTAPLVLICEMIRVVTVACSTSTKKKANTVGFIRSVGRSSQSSMLITYVSQYCRKITMQRSERPTRAEPYEVPAYEDVEIEHPVCSCVQHHIVRPQSFLQTDLPLLSENVQNVAE